MRATKPDEPLYGNAVAISKVEDTKTYFAQFEEFYQLQFGASKVGQPIAMSEIHHIQVDGHEVLEIISSAKQIEGLQPSPRRSKRSLSRCSAPTIRSTHTWLQSTSTRSSRLLSA